MFLDACPLPRPEPGSLESFFFDQNRIEIILFGYYTDNRKHCRMAIACLMHEERRRKGDPPRAEQKITTTPRTTNHSVGFFLRENADRLRVQELQLAKTQLNSVP